MKELLLPLLVSSAGRKIWTRSQTAADDGVVECVHSKKQKCTVLTLSLGL